LIGRKNDLRKDLGKQECVMKFRLVLALFAMLLAVTLPELAQARFGGGGGGGFHGGGGFRGGGFSGFRGGGFRGGGFSGFRGGGFRGGFRRFGGGFFPGYYPGYYSGYYDPCWGLPYWRRPYCYY
jgi:hypothetical protein